MASGRVFLRGIASDTYSLEALRSMQRGAARVRGPEIVVDDGSVGHTPRRNGSSTLWRVGPGDDPFLTQTIQVSISELAPGASNTGHGHQNEAAFYILEGAGHEIHDGVRYDWKAGDLVVVHTDSVHRHFNDSDERAVLLILKAKSLWMYLGLFQQGRRQQWDETPEFGPREDWSQLWTPGVEGMTKVVRSEDTVWEETRDGLVRVYASEDRDDVRLFSVDLYEQKIGPGDASARHWHMADEVVYVLEGSGVSVHWDVEAEIDDRYYARIRRESSRHEVRAGDVLYVPPNTVHQHVAGSEGLRILCAHNRIFSMLGYGSVAYPEPLSEGDGE